LIEVGITLAIYSVKRKEAGKGGEKMMDNGKSLLKFLGSLIIGIIGLWLIYTIITGPGVGSIGYHGGGYEHMSYGVSGASMIGTTSFILLLLIKLLFVLFIIGLVVGIALVIKNYIFTKEDVEKIKNTFVGNKTAAVKHTCNACGKVLDDQWKVCPYCGSEIENIVA